MKIGFVKNQDLNAVMKSLYTTKAKGALGLKVLKMALAWDAANNKFDKDLKELMALRKASEAPEATPEEPSADQESKSASDSVVPQEDKTAALDEVIASFSETEVEMPTLSSVDVEAFPSISAQDLKLLVDAGLAVL
jgi:hypothetical protein